MPSILRNLARGESQIEPEISPEVRVRVRVRARVRVRVRVSLTLTLPLTRRPSRSALSRLWRRRRGCTCNMARCSRVSCVPKMGRC